MKYKLISLIFLISIFMVSGLFGSMGSDWRDMNDDMVDFNVAVETGMGDPDDYHSALLSSVNDFIETYGESYGEEIKENVIIYLELMEQFNIDNSNIGDIIDQYRLVKDLM